MNTGIPSSAKKRFHGDDEVCISLIYVLSLSCMHTDPRSIRAAQEAKTQSRSREYQLYNTLFARSPVPKIVLSAPQGVAPYEDGNDSDSDWSDWSDGDGFVHPAHREAKEPEDPALLESIAGSSNPKDDNTVRHGLYDAFGPVTSTDHLAELVAQLNEEDVDLSDSRNWMPALGRGRPSEQTMRKVAIGTEIICLTAKTVDALTGYPSETLLSVGSNFHKNRGDGRKAVFSHFLKDSDPGQSQVVHIQRGC